MPRGDGTGPNGLGPRTGRGLGYCNGYNSPGFTRGGYGFRGGYGYRGGFHRGYGWGGYYNQNYIPSQEVGTVSEKTLIENELRILNERVEALQKRLNEIGKTETE